MSDTPVHVVEARRIALIADTHCHAPGAADLPEAVLAGLSGVDLILHLGDMGDSAVRERLGAVAPLLTTRGEDDPPDGPSTIVVEAGGLSVGALFDLAAAGLGRFEGGLKLDHEFGRRVRARFGRSIDVLAFAGTHDALVAHHAGLLVVNRGSPNLPARPGPAGLGTLAFLEVADGTATVAIHQL